MSNDTFFINGELSTRDKFINILRNKGRYKTVEVEHDVFGQHKLTFYSTSRQSGKSLFYNELWNGIPITSTYQDEYMCSFINRGEIHYEGGILKY